MTYWTYTSAPPASTAATAITINAMVTGLRRFTLLTYTHAAGSQHRPHRYHPRGAEDRRARPGRGRGALRARRRARHHRPPPRRPPAHAGPRRGSPAPHRHHAPQRRV